MFAQGRPLIHPEVGRTSAHGFPGPQGGVWEGLTSEVISSPVVNSSACLNAPSRGLDWAGQSSGR